MSQTKAQLINAVDGSITDADIVGLSSSKLSGALPAISGASLTGISAGKILQIVQASTTGTNNYASVDFQNTVIAANITPTASNSKFLIKAVVQFGIGSKQCAVSLNFSDSLHASGTTHPIAPMSGDGTNGASNSRLPAFFGIGTFDDASDVDNYFVGNVYGEFLYTPASASSSQRTFTVMVRSSFGDNVRLNMNAHYNAGNPRDYRPTSTITIMEVEA